MRCFLCGGGGIRRIVLGAGSGLWQTPHFEQETYPFGKIILLSVIFLYKIPLNEIRQPLVADTIPPKEMPTVWKT
ncbi:MULTISPECIES: hypothetical protein [Cupriavidus]